jgi:hypothetical protein
MPYSPEQMRAIAARMRAEGKSREQIRAFFHKHGGSVKRDHPMMKRARRGK